MVVVPHLLFVGIDDVHEDAVVLGELRVRGDVRRVAILGSLYLAGVVLTKNGPLPD